MKIRAITAVFFLCAGLAACSGQPGSPQTPTTDETASAPNSDTSVPDDPAPPHPTTPQTSSPDTPVTDTSSTGQPPSADMSLRYQRADLGNYASGLADGQISFSSTDGAVKCEFQPREENAPIDRPPSLDWRLGYAEGACQFADTFAQVDSDPSRNPVFAQEVTGVSIPMPEMFTPLPAGTFLDLHTMGCFAPSAGSIACTKYATNDTFTADSQGFSLLSPYESADLLTTSGGFYQALSTTVVLNDGEANAMTCFFEMPGSTDFWCQSLGESRWENGNNLLHFVINNGEVISASSQVGNPGLEYYRGRQLASQTPMLIDATLAVTNDGERVAFYTPQGASFWVTPTDYGLGV